jgi:type 2 lantibiotic biosynthesis protein LanM
MPMLEAAIEEAANVLPLVGDGLIDRAQRETDPVPFEEILLPFVRVARRELDKRVGHLALPVTSEAVSDLEHDLLNQLAYPCARALDFEFAIARLRARKPQLTWVVEASYGTSQQRYFEFVTSILGQGFLSFWRAYPVLARLASTVTSQWVEYSVEFLSRLSSDYLLIQTLEGSQPIGPVSAIQPGLSDPHRFGKTVLRARFESGACIVYKPRSLDMEEAFYSIVAWLNRHSGMPLLRVISVINRRTYGWMECVQQSECQSEVEVADYFRRAGMLLCLAYCLRAGDLHRENIIAAADQPVLVDLELLLHADVKPRDETSEGMHPLVFEQTQWDTVLGTGLLPTWTVGSGGRTVDLSGLAGLGDQESLMSEPSWLNLNSDEMTLVWRQGRLRPQANEVTHSGTVRSPSRYAGHIDEGFSDMYRAIMGLRDGLLSTDGPLSSFGRCTGRFLVRPTRVYRAILDEALDPKNLRSGVDFSISVDIVARGFLTAKNPTVFWPLCRAEQAALERLDIPYFSVSSSTEDLTLDELDTRLGCLRMTPYAGVIARIESLSAADLETQRSLIAVALRLRSAARIEVADRDVDADEPTVSATLKPPYTGFLPHAVKIADKIRREAILLATNTPTWVGTEYLPESGRLLLQPLGYDLYKGSAGISLFLSAVGFATKDERLSRFALAAMLPLRRAVRDDPVRLARTLGLGGFAGLGSVVYGLVRVAELTGDSGLLEDARAAVVAISAERIESDTRLDVMYGSAGAALALLAYYAATKDPDAGERIIACGRHLLATRVQSDHVGAAWRTVGGQCLTGFSHGAAGIAYALLRIHELSGEGALLLAAQEAIAYEASVFDAGAKNWPDLRPWLGGRAAPVFQNSWCHGAPGIGLARIGGLSLLDSSGIRNDIDAALATTDRGGLGELDQLCCGAMGRIDILEYASRALGRPSLMKSAHALAAQLIRRAELKQEYALFPGIRMTMSPGLFQGLSGIGYELLRLHNPDAYKTVLLLE